MVLGSGSPGRAAALTGRRPPGREYRAFGWQVPGAFGIMLRGLLVPRRMKRAAGRVSVLAGCRFRAIENLEVGHSVAIGFDNYIDATNGIRMGSYVTLAPGVKIWTSLEDAPEAGAEAGSGSVEIGDNVFIAANALILPGTRVPEGCVIATGAVVGPKEYAPFAILAGNPARVIGYRGGRSPDAALAGEADAAAGPA